MTQDIFSPGGPCSPVPQAKNTVFSRDGQLCWAVATHVVPELDLDGSNSPVVLVPCDAPGLYPDTMRWDVYVMRGECAHPVGTIDGLNDPFELPGRSHGLKNIGTMRPSQLASGLSHGQVMTRYVFDGEKYRAGRRERR
ncbi:MAG: hypothetical protein Q8K43_03750 [Sulfurimicrobium sp.]|nr:hypothetical protein [Sulfurimicrobium sp.]MDP1896981.1 hypothetical protein [Sulfurimicrobium sp.]MDP2199564.1 hypothetical protein [Sulfurimicrobium sp.]MDP2961347.1 hypothetical protein [Sulfurimicrobium sp.]MDP3688683.1 hypothetical protein [Sulfurimicrobium sp.]